MQTITLPHPGNPNSLEAVQRSVDNLSNVGKAVFGVRDANSGAFVEEHGSVLWEFDYGEEIWLHVQDGEDGNLYEEEAAALLTLAGQRTGPIETCNCRAMIDSPLAATSRVQMGTRFH
jgi:hypothetical protein